MWTEMWTEMEQVVDRKAFWAHSGPPLVRLWSTFGPPLCFLVRASKHAFLPPLARLYFLVRLWSAFGPPFGPPLVRLCFFFGPVLVRHLVRLWSAIWSAFGPPFGPQLSRAWAVGGSDGAALTSTISPYLPIPPPQGDRTVRVDFPRQMVGTLSHEKQLKDINMHRYTQIC